MFAEWLNEDSGQSSKACLRQKSEDLNSHLECASNWLGVQFCVPSSVLWNWHGWAWLLRRVRRRDRCQHLLVVGETCKLFSFSPDPGNWSLWVWSPEIYVLTSSLGDSDSRFSSSYPCQTDLRIRLERFLNAIYGVTQSRTRLNQLSSSRLSPTAAEPFYILTNSAWGSQFLHIVPTTRFFQFVW